MLRSTSPREPRLQSEYVTSAIIAMIQSRYKQLWVATSQHSRLGFSIVCVVLYFKRVMALVCSIAVLNRTMCVQLSQRKLHLAAKVIQTYFKPSWNSWCTCTISNATETSLMHTIVYFEGFQNTVIASAWNKHQRFSLLQNILQEAAKDQRAEWAMQGHQFPAKQLHNFT